MFEFLPGAGTVVLEDADVFEALVPLEVLDALGGEEEELLNLSVRSAPQLAIVAGVLDENLVGANWTHPIIQAFAATASFAFDVIERGGMDDGTARPRATESSRQRRDALQRRTGLRTKWTCGRRRRRVHDIVAGDDP
jgi:hypothetical protein